MCHRIDDVMKLCCELSANQQIQTTVKGSGKGAAAAGGLAFAGGLVGGPLGIAVGKFKMSHHNFFFTTLPQSIMHSMYKITWFVANIYNSVRPINTVV